MSTLFMPAVAARVGAQMSGHDLIDERYQLMTLRGQSAAAETWTARDLRLGRHVTLELAYSDEKPSSQLDIAIRREQLPTVYDAGTCAVADRWCTFVVTPLPDPIAEAPPASPGMVDVHEVREPELVPLSVGEWTTTVTVHRRRKPRTGAHAAATVSVRSRLAARLKRAGDVPANSVAMPAATLATNVA